jgi:hypothetical protein
MSEVKSIEEFLRAAAENAMKSEAENTADSVSREEQLEAIEKFQSAYNTETAGELGFAAGDIIELKPEFEHLFKVKLAVILEVRKNEGVIINTEDEGTYTYGLRNDLLAAFYSPQGVVLPMLLSSAFYQKVKGESSEGNSK